MSEREYRKPLDFIVDFCAITSTKSGDSTSLVIHDDSKDIMRWNAINIYEDIFRNFMSCQVAILDQDGGFLDRIRTEEIITIKFRTPGKAPRTHHFYLYKVNPIIPLDKIMGAEYIVHGISVEFFNNSLRAFSRSYFDKTENIVAKIYDEYLKSSAGLVKPLNIPNDSKTKYQMKFSFPYVNPIEAINHLASVSINEKNPNACNYLFYENKDGFWYTCLEEMFKSKRGDYLYNSSQTLLESYLLFENHLDKTVRVEVQNTGDKIVDTIDGVYGEYFSEFDLLYKKYKPYVNPNKKDTDYLEVKAEGKRYLDYFDKTTHVEPKMKPLISKENEIFHYPLGRNRVCFTNGALYSDQVKNASGQVTGWKLYETYEGEYSFNRRSQMQQINLFTLEVTVPGNSDITVGDVCRITAPIYRNGNGKFIDGRYLVAAVTHKIVPSGYQTVMNLARDGIVVQDFDTKTEGIAT